MFTAKLGIIGVGVMGQAILGSVVDKKILHPNEIALFDLAKEKLEPYQNDYIICKTEQELIDCAEVILFSIKPQHFSGLCENVTIPENKTILSIMAGIPIKTIRQKTGSTCGIARVMPNTPCRIGHGVCALCFSNVLSEKQSFIHTILSSCGKVVEVKETLFDTVTSVSGSGPAYVYMFLDGMIRGGMNGGMTYEQSKEFAIQTVIGTSLLAEQSSESLDVLTEKVCSKGGTTIEAVKIFREKGLIDIVEEGIAACKKRSEELSKQA